MRSSANEDRLSRTAIATRYGGTGESLAALAEIAFDLGRAPRHAPFGPSMYAAAPAITLLGDEDQRQRWLPGLAAGRLVGSFGWVDPRQPPTISISARAGTCRVTARGLFVPEGMLADLVIVSAVAPQGPATVIVPIRSSGVSVRPAAAIDSTHRNALIDMDEAAAERLGVEQTEASGYSRMLDIAMTLFAFELLGCAEEVFQQTIAYTVSRKTFGRAVAANQATRHRLVALYESMLVSRLACERARGELDGTPAALAILGPAAWFAASCAATDCTREAVHMHGGIATISESKVHAQYRRARTLCSYFGGRRAQGRAVGRSVRRVQAVVQAEHRGDSSQSEVHADPNATEDAIARTLRAFGDSSTSSTLARQIELGRSRWCPLIVEPGAGVDLSGISTVARRCADGWRIHGKKIWSQHADRSDCGFLLARADDAAEGTLGLTCFRVDMRAPGVQVLPIRLASQRQGFCEVILQDVLVEDADRIGPIGEGWSVSSHLREAGSLDLERIAISTFWNAVSITDSRLAAEADGNADIDGRLAQGYTSVTALQTLMEGTDHARLGLSSRQAALLGRRIAARLYGDLADWVTDYLGCAGEDIWATGSPIHPYLLAPEYRLQIGVEEVLADELATTLLRLPIA